MSQDVNSSPTVSVLLSVYNGEQFLHEAVDSILHQTFEDFEFIIIDDGSTDETAAILKSYRDPRIIRLHHAPNQGLVTSLNQGLAQASGEFIARHDADDISLPDRLKEQVRYFREDPQLVIVGSHFHSIDETGQHVKISHTPSSDTEIRWTSLFECPFAHNSVMVRTEALRRHGLWYDKERLHVEDYDLWSRLLLYGKGKNIDQPLVKRRRHPGRISKVFVTEQIANADRIAWSNVQRLEVTVSVSEVRRLRSWLWEPQLVTAQDVRNCRHLLEILGKFGEQDDAEPRQFASIRYRWVNRILRVMSLSDLFRSEKVQLVGILIRDHLILVIRHLIKRMLGQIEK